MDEAQRADFVSGYTKILTNAWSDEAFRARLTSEPREALAENGLSVPASADVKIVTGVAGEPSLEDQVERWAKGETSGEYELFVPDQPQIDTSELSESELEGVAGGDTYCCSCCPCCTCT
jgi:hypothetical protein